MFKVSGVQPYWKFISIDGCYFYASRVMLCYVMGILCYAVLCWHCLTADQQFDRISSKPRIGIPISSWRIFLNIGKYREKSASRKVTYISFSVDLVDDMILIGEKLGKIPFLRSFSPLYPLDLLIGWHNSADCFRLFGIYLNFIIRWSMVVIVTLYVDILCWWSDVQKHLNPECVGSWKSMDFLQ